MYLAKRTSGALVSPFSSPSLYFPALHYKYSLAQAVEEFLQGEKKPDDVWSGIWGRCCHNLQSDHASQRYLQIA